MSERIDRPMSREELVFDVHMALQKNQGLWPKRRLPGDHDRLKPLARAIVSHLELCGTRFVGKTAGGGYGPPLECSPDKGGQGQGRAGSPPLAVAAATTVSRPRGT